jgi:hypothetical protein
LKCGGWRNESWTFLCIYPTFVLLSIHPTSRQTRSHCRVAYSAIQFPWIASGLESSVFVCNLRIICRKGALFTKKGSSFCIHVEDYKFHKFKNQNRILREFFCTCRRPAILPLDLYLSVREVRLHWIRKICFTKCKLLQCRIFQCKLILLCRIPVWCLLKYRFCRKHSEKLSVLKPNFFVKYLYH